jgi:hypothetical protein
VVQHILHRLRAPTSLGLEEFLQQITA